METNISQKFQKDHGLWLPLKVFFCGFLAARNETNTRIKLAIKDIGYICIF